MSEKFYYVKQLDEYTGEYSICLGRFSSKTLAISECEIWRRDYPEEEIGVFQVTENTNNQFVVDDDERQVY